MDGRIYKSGLSIIVLMLFSAGTAFGQVALWRSLMIESSNLAAEKNYEKAISVAEEALEVAETTFSVHDQGIEKSLSLLVDLHTFAGETEKAKVYKKRLNKILVEKGRAVLRKTEKEYGVRHPYVRAPLVKLAIIYMDQQRYKVAVDLLEQAVKYTEDSYGKSAIELDYPLYYLALASTGLGDYDKTEKAYIRLLSIRTKHLGSYDPSTIKVFVMFAEFYMSIDKPFAAEGFYKEALASQEKITSPDDPSLIPILEGLGRALLAQKKFDEAGVVVQRALALQVNSLGDNHSDIAGRYLEIAAVHMSNKNYSEAETALLKALAIQEETYGKESVMLMEALDNLGFVYSYQGKYKKAETVFLRVLKIKEKNFAPGDPNNMVTIRGLADVYYAKGQKDKAYALFEKILATDQKALGENHTRNADTLLILGDIAFSQGDVYTAQSYYERSIEIREASGEPEHINVAIALSNLGAIYLNDQLWSPAEEKFLRALEIQKKSLDSASPEIAATLANLAGIYHYTNRFGDSEKYY